MSFCPSLNAIRSLRRMTMRLLRAFNLKQKFCVKFRKFLNPESKAVNDCRELLLWIIPQIDKLPRVRRYTLGEKLENRLLVVLESLVTAAYAPNKSTFLFQANRDLQYLGRFRKSI